jgi:hypothetical protein
VHQAKCSEWPAHCDRGETLGRDGTSCYFNELIETVNEKKLTAKWRASEHDCSMRRESSMDLL